MVLPGIQALFGFQLIAVFNIKFGELSVIEKYLHLAALLLTIMAIACLMAPASYHRQVEQNSASKEFIAYASTLICIGMVPLLISISLDTYVVASIITHNIFTAGFATGFSVVLLSTLWYLIPLSKKSAYQHERDKF